MTRKGLIYAILSASILLTGFILSSRSLYYVGMTLLLYLGMSYFVVHWNRKSLYMMFFISSKRVARLEEIKYEYVITNKSLMPIFYSQVCLEFKKEMGIAKGETHRLFFQPYQTMTLMRGAICNKRGYYVVGNMVVYFTDALGLFVKRLNVEKSVEITVLPRIMPVRFNKNILKDLGGVKSAKSKLDMDQSSVKNMRAYAFGDSLKHIHWKISAKEQKLFTKQYELTSDPSALVIFNGNKEDEIDDDTVDAGVSMCHALIKRGYTTEVIFPGKDYERRRYLGRSGIDDLLETAAAFEPYSALSFHEQVESEIKKTSGDLLLFLVSKKVIENIDIPAHTKVYFVTPSEERGVDWIEYETFSS